MARKKKKTVDYFPHEVNHGKTMTILEKKWGNDGYAFWFKLLEMLGDSEGHFLDLSKGEERIYLASETNLKEDECIEILDLLSRLDAIDSDLWEKERIVWSDNFLDAIRDVYRKRASTCPEKPGSRVEKKGSRHENPTKESKGKESKANTKGSDDPEKEKNQDNANDFNGGQVMAKIRSKIPDDIPDQIADAIEKAMGQIIFSDLSDKRKRWIVDNHRHGLIADMLNASQPNEVYQYKNQYMNSTVRPEMQEARLWKDEDDEKTNGALDKLIDEAFGGDDNDDQEPDDTVNRQEIASEVVERFG